MGQLKTVTVELTEKQEEFLKLFAKKQYDGSVDNVGTETPIHVVQSRVYNHIPYSEDLEGHYDDEYIRYSGDDAYEVWYKSVEEMVKESIYEWGNAPIKFMEYGEAEYREFTTVNGEEFYIQSEEEYLEMYGLKLTGKCWSVPYWKDVAIFFIRDEAERYIGYQRHNLVAPRVYTKSLGYSNYGDFPHFRALLMSMGEVLNEEGKKEGDK